MRKTMKQNHLLKIVIGLMIATAPILAQSQESKPGAPSRTSSSSPTSAEVALNNYYRDQASKQIEQILPKGKFGVQVSLKINASKIKSDFEIEPVKLPLGDSFVTGNEIKASGLVDQSLERLISYVEKVDVTVSVAPGLPNQVQELITNSLKQMLLIDTRRGDSITFKELPQAILTAWNPEPSIEIYKKPAMILSGYFGVILLFVALAVMLGFRQMGIRVTREASALIGTIREGIENSMAMSGGMPSQASMGAQAAAPVKMESSGPMGSDFWDKVESETVVAFCFDCISQPTYMAVPSIMVSGILDPEKSAEVETRLPYEYVVGFNGKTNLKSSDVTAMFQKHQTEYRRAIRSAASKQLIETELEKVIEFSHSLEQFELALLLNALTPFKRTGLLKTLSTDSKLQLAKASQEKLSVAEQKKFEISLLEKIEKLTEGQKKQKAESNSLNYLTSIILSVESFAEDESLYEKMGSEGGYTGVLLAFEHFNEQTWDEFNLQDLVMAFCGYSEKYKNSLISKFSGKKQEWVKNFLVKFQQNQPDFHSPQVEAVHEMIKNRINTIQGAKSEDRQAA
jgi:hypothetical protein